ncbi:hypothetical protein ACC741_38650, partial [Rhizobium johnstonii]
MRLAISFLVKCLFSRLLLVFILLTLPIGAATSQAAGEKKAAHPTMNFILVRSLLCQENCPEWISA